MAWPEMHAGAEETTVEEDLLRLAAQVMTKLKLRREFWTDAAEPQPPPRGCTSKSSDANEAASPNPEDDQFIMLPGPATIVKLKEACGSFSAAAMLKNALSAERGKAAASSEGWVLLGQS